MSEQSRTPLEILPTTIDFLSRRKMTTAMGSIILAVMGCSNPDQYVGDKTPHDVYSNIEEGKVFPSGGSVIFDEGIATYSPTIMTNPDKGIFKIDASCGNPIDKRDKKQNVYAYITTNDYTNITVSIKDFKPCADGKLTKNELKQLQTGK